jgi:lysophospholipid acyltransferase (LPLAT)-like uncharacterized protein
MRKRVFTVILHTIAISSTIVTVHASVNIRALHVLSLVLLASNVRDAMLVNPLVGSIGITSVACSSIAAIDQSLNCRNDITLLSLGLDFEAIGNATESSVGPTRTAITIYNITLHSKFTTW